MKQLKNLINDESGATAIEYGLIASGISVAIVPIVSDVGDNLRQTFTIINDAIASR